MQLLSRYGTDRPVDLCRSAAPRGVVTRIDCRPISSWPAAEIAAGALPGTGGLANRNKRAQRHLALASPRLVVFLAVVTALVTFLMPTASFASGHTIKATQISMCPDNDGSSGASTGTPQYASVAALGISSTYKTQINSGVTSLGCKVAGVDYYVGLSTTQTLKDPTLGGLPSGCSYASNTVTCSGNNITFQGWDLTLHNGIALSVAGSGNTITQNKLGGGGTNCPNPPVFFSAVGGTTTFTYNTVIGNAGACGYLSWNGTLQGGVASGGTLVIEWNYIHNSTEDMIALNGPSSGNAVYIEKYNLKDTQGWFGHPDGIQFCGGNFNAVTIAHDTYRNTTTPAGAGGTQPFHVEAQCTAAISNTVIAYNTIVTPGTTGAQTANFDIACKQDSGGNTNTNFSAYGNYIDAGGAYGAIVNSYACPSTTWGTPQANYRMDTGLACSGVTCN